MIAREVQRIYSATLRAFALKDGGWRQVFGPWSANVGYNGFAPPGQKREGDGRTPSGSYGFSFFFGVDANPLAIIMGDPKTGSQRLSMAGGINNFGTTIGPLLVSFAIDCSQLYIKVHVK